MATDRPLDIDRLTIDAVRDGALRDRPITVLGFARSGIALARFLADAGAEVTVYDGRPEADLSDAMARLDGRRIRLLAGPDVDPATAWDGAALVTTSPSINPDYPTTEPRLRQALRALVDARRAGDPAAPALVSEPDLFLRLCPSPTVGVTGTKGKTTTASLIELSELQLPTLSRGTTVAVYTNVTSDHLDRHGSVEAYRAAKRRLAELVDPDGAVVLNADDPISAAYAGVGRARNVMYGFGPPQAGGVGVVDGWIVGDAIGPILPIDELAIPGEHNVSNALAAVATGLIFGISPDAIRRAAVAFEGVEHRLELVSVVDGVRFINDSQGTQPDAVAAALRAFDPPIVLIAGGRDKDIDLSALGPVVAQRAAAAVLIGESGPTLDTLFQSAGLVRTERAETLEGAVRRADAIARELLESGEPGPATVLLSPAAASFDMFVDYAARGRAFKVAVADLARERQGRRTE